MSWSEFFQFYIFCMVFLFLVSLWKNVNPGKNEETEKQLSGWLYAQGHNTLVMKNVLGEKGISSLEKLAFIDLDEVDKLGELSDEQKNQMKSQITNLKAEKMLEIWLKMIGLEDFFSKFKEHQITNIINLWHVREESLQEVFKKDRKLKGYIKLKDSLSTKSLEDIESEVRTFVQHHNGGKKLEVPVLTNLVYLLIITSLIAVGIIMFFGMKTYTQFPDRAHLKTPIVDYLCGKYAAPQYCTVHWEWEDPEEVGKTMSFVVKFFQRNGKPYPISDADNILVEITLAGVKIASTMEFGGTNPNSANEAKVAFTVHRSGNYSISVMMGARHIKGSPFVKNFESGPIDATKTCFMNYSSTVVCTAGSSHPLTIETRDSFGNLAAYKADQNNYFKIKVTEAGTNHKYVPTTQIIYDPFQKRLTMHIKMEREGCYQATVTYGDIKLKNGDFNILVLSSEENAAVTKNIAKKSHIWYEARLISYNNEVLDKAKKVYVYISPKQLTLKEFYLKIIGKKLHTFRVCPLTKFLFNGFNNQYESPVFTIDDGAQPSVVLAAKDRNIIAATFTSFLLKNIGGSETFQDKQTFFHHEIRQLHSGKKHSSLGITIDRSRLLYTSYRATRNFDVSDWCRNFEIHFSGEQGLDYGGLKREWFEVLCTELFDPNGSGLFRRFSDSSQGLVHPHSRRQPELKIKYYEFAGKIVGKCLYESALGGGYRQLVKARFSRSFLALLMGLRVNYKYFETDDTEFYKTKIKYIEENDVDDLELTFSEEEFNESGQPIRVVDLIPNGSKIPVTNKNKLRYLDLLAQHRLVNTVKEEVEYFLKGLNELIPDNLLNIFDENELELLMCGTGQYSISDFRQNHVVCGTRTSAFSKVLDWFWTIVTSFSEEHMARLLQFTTGCSQLPAGGFCELSPKFQISSSVSFNTLPTAHTCFNQLCLPDYESIDIFHRNLLLAINEGSQGFGMM